MFFAFPAVHYMNMRTLFVENPPPPGGEVILERREAEHLFRVLRAAIGERFRLLNGRGVLAVAEVLEGGVLRVESVESIPEPAVKVHLFFAVPRRNRLDGLLPACSELGVWRLHPVICSRSVAEGSPNTRWRLQLIEGCKQSGNPFLPAVSEPEPLLPALRRAAAAGMKLFYGSVAPAGAPRVAPVPREVGWVVGPEGGFTAEEEAGMRELGVSPLNLGSWVMRLETAALCGVAVLRRMMMLLLPLLLAAVVSGCGEGRDVSRHPLIRKGDYYRDNGDARLAAEFYRRAGEKYPRSAVPHLRMATLCDEALNDPLGAAWHYREYLRLAPDSVERETVDAYRAAALSRLGSAPPPEAIRKLEEENRRLRSGLNELKLRVLEMQRSRRNGMSRYTVRAGDTPAQIARRHRVDLESLLRANGLNRSSRLSIGRELVIPAPRDRR